MPSANHIATYTEVWKDIQKVLWKAVIESQQPHIFVYAELKKRVDKTDYYIKGAKITGWEDVYTDETRFTEENGVYTLTVDLEEGDEFIFTSMVTVGETSGVGTEYIRYSNIAADDLESQSFVTGTDSANLVASQAGTYTFTYDASTKVLTVNCQ